MKNHKLMALAAALFAAGAVCLAQTKQEQVIEGGGTGPWKSVAVEDASLPTHTIYRPKDLKGYVDENGKIPVLLYANGACANNNLEMSRLLSEVASWGYIVLAIGPYQDMPDDAFYAQWKGVVRGWYPETKEVAIMGNGERLTPYTEAELAARAAEQEAARKAAEAAAKKNKGKKAAPAPAPFRTYARQLLEAMDWITDQCADAQSEYYHCVDLDKVAAMGQSCGGAQVLAVAHDPRIKTCLIFKPPPADALPERRHGRCGLRERQRRLEADQGASRREDLHAGRPPRHVLREARRRLCRRMPPVAQLAAEGPGGRFRPVHERRIRQDGPSRLDLRPEELVSL